MTPISGSLSPSAPRGIVTAAVRDRRYLEMAVDLALSARDIADLPVALVTDATTEKHVRLHYPDVFDHITLVPDRFRYRRGLKYCVAEASPFAHALYVDADAWIVGDVGPLFEDVESSEESVLVHGDLHHRDSRAVHHSFPVAELLDRFGRTGYLKCNAGVIGFRKAEAIPIMDELLRRYRDELVPELKRGFLGNELPIGVYGVELGIGTFRPPGPLHWAPELQALDLASPKKPIVHLIDPVEASAFGSLVHRSEARRMAAGLRLLQGRHWHWKHGLTRRSRFWNAILTPIEQAVRPSIGDLGS